MDKLVIENKLESLRRCINRIESKKPFSVEELSQNLDLQDIIVINLERAVQVCVDICCHIISSIEKPPPLAMAASFETLKEEGWLTEDCSEQMKRAVGFRNIAVHQYQNLNWDIVHAVAYSSLSYFVQFAKEVSDKSEVL